MRAEKRVELQKWNKSILWSPRFRPSTFKYFFLPCLLFPIGLVQYLTRVHYPKKIVKNI